VTAKSAARELLGKTPKPSSRIGCQL
jgi:hypothetical protein